MSRSIWLCALLVSMSGAYVRSYAQVEPSLSGKWYGEFDFGSYRATHSLYLNQNGNILTGICDTDFIERFGEKSYVKIALQGRLLEKKPTLKLTGVAVLDSLLPKGTRLCLCTRYLEYNETQTELKGYMGCPKCDADTVFITYRRVYAVPRLTHSEVYFEPASSDLTLTERTKVDQLAAVLKASPNLNVELMGFTDFSQNTSRLQQLAIARARSVAIRLQAQGVDPRRFKASGYGFQHIENPDEAYDPKADPRNRRVEFRLWQ